MMLRSANGVTGIVEVSNLHPSMSGLAEFSVSGSKGLFHVSSGVAKLVTSDGEEPVKLASKGQGGRCSFGVNRSHAGVKSGHR